MGRLETLTNANENETLAYLARRPFDNVYVHWLIASRQIARVGEILLGRDARGAISGVCYVGQNVVVCGDSATIDAFAESMRGSRMTRMIVGPRAAVERFWSIAKTVCAKPVATRASQPVYALERSGLRATGADGDVDRASLDEVDEIVPHSAAMIAGEIGGDPHRTGSEFLTRTASIIDRGWWWRARVDGKLAFMCNVGSASPYTAQLQGVWTPPDMRGNGYATRALATICGRLLADHPTLCLYVNDFNAPAIALYERVGFERVGEFATILLP